VLDVMGGDHAPRAILEGALRAIEKGHAHAGQILLAGSADVVRAELGKLGRNVDSFELLDAPDQLGCNESPIEAMRKKPKNAISLGMIALREGRAQAFVSAGSTGGVVAAATVGLGCLEGIRRPGIAVTIEGDSGPFVACDVGANPQPKPLHLLHYAIMGSAYYHDTFGKEAPRVGLMNIGSEDAKGNQFTKEVGQLLREAPIQFVGNVEGVDVFSGKCDVIVCDGFTGNVLLKVSEGVAEYLLRTTVRFMDEAGVPREKKQLVLQKLHPRVDYSEYGGALLLGVRGIVTICHGRSQAPAICNALRFALQAVGASVNQHIVAAAKAIAPST
jgi:glycerol-3-phosphate acyltransferase PlsX